MVELGHVVLRKVSLGHIFVLRLVSGLAVWVDCSLGSELFREDFRWWLDFD